MRKPLRILLIVNVPWDQRLGVARVYVELAEQWTTAGHIVEKFSLNEAFPMPTQSPPLATLRERLFPYRAAHYTRKNASRFDVIDALIGTMPFSKKQLRFHGLLVARSTGFPRAYQSFDRVSQERWPDQPRGKVTGRLFYGLTRGLHYRNCERSLRHCDLVNLLNQDEVPLLQRPPAIRKPFIVQPNGLSDKEVTAFAAAIQSADIRLERKEICFVGGWSLRKGARDWPEIVRRVRSVIPTAGFNFLGTMTNEYPILNDLQLASSDRVRVVSNFDREELPSLLGSCAVGLFPSYIEGFGLAVLEQLAAGIPVIAYDVPGPRHILEPLGTMLLVGQGDAGGMADRAVKILTLSASDYRALCNQCRLIASQYRWEKIAADTTDEYRAHLEQLHDNSDSVAR